MSACMRGPGQCKCNQSFQLSDFGTHTIRVHCLRPDIPAWLSHSYLCVLSTYVVLLQVMLQRWWSRDPPPRASKFGHGLSVCLASHRPVICWHLRPATNISCAPAHGPAPSSPCLHLHTTAHRPAAREPLAACHRLPAASPRLSGAISPSPPSSRL
jgi:hypothetical protein